MLTNTDCTIYHRVRDPLTKDISWVRQYVERCWWFKNTASNISTEGVRNADVLTIRILDMEILVEKDDCVIKGNCDVQIKTISDLEGYDYFKVTTANRNVFGDNPHIKVVCV